MQRRTSFGWGLLVLAITSVGLKAQIPGIPGIPGVPTTPTVPTTLPSSLIPPSNLWSMLCPTDAQLLRWQQMFCKSFLGKMSSSMLSPVSLYTGGLMGECCPPGLFPPPPGSPQDTADKIKADEAAAKARRAAMRYLGTVDCHYWPEAESSLITGLRTDKNECVRWEAAHSLGNGCCCTRKTIAALKLVVEGSEKDGNPSETSIWVKGEALASLQHCICCFRDKPAEVPKEKAGPTAAATPEVLPAYYYNLNDIPRERFVADTSQVIAQASAAGLKPPTVLQPGAHSVSTILAKAADPKMFPRPAAPLEPPLGEPPTGRLQPVAAGTGAPPTAPKPVGRDLYTILKERWGRETITTIEYPATAVPTIQPIQATQPAAPAPSVAPPTGNRDLFTIFKNSIGGQ